MNTNVNENDINNSNSKQPEKEDQMEKILKNKILIGGEDILKRQIESINYERSNEEEKQKKAKVKFEEKFEEMLKDLRIRIGTLLKTDNVSFLLGAGTSIKAGGVSIAKIPLEIERALLEKGINNEKAEEWLNLFYQLVSASMTDFTPKDPLERKKLLCESNERQLTDKEIPQNLEILLTNLNMWKAGIISSCCKIIETG